MLSREPLQIFDMRRPVVEAGLQVVRLVLAIDGVEHRFLFFYAFTPAPIRRGASSSSGQRGRGAKSSGLCSPKRKRSSPAQAIIAALSVQRRKGGATKARPASRAHVSSSARNAPFAATPPATTSALKLGWLAHAAAMARRVRSIRLSTTAIWNPAARFARDASSSGPSCSTLCRRAVFKPLKEKLSSALPFIGRGRSVTGLVAARAARSIDGPPG